MTATQSRTLGVALAVAALVVMIGVGREETAEDAPPDKTRRVDRARDVEQRYEDARARLAAGARIVSRKRISDTEEIEVVLIPEAYSEALDTRCVVYKNSELNTSSLACSGAGWRRADGS
ncbi:MAG TPA: hypothetical protein VIQ62_04715 [Burkholderiales bacterium]